MRSAFAGALALVTVAVSAPAEAAGFAIPEQTARATGAAGTGVASSIGAAGIYYNPGAVAFEDGIAAELSLLMLLPTLTATNTTRTASWLSATFPGIAPTFFVAAPVTERLYLGLGAFSAFGARVKWPADFPGRFEGSGSDLTTYTFNPTVSLRVNDDIGIGAGFDLVRAAVQLDRQLDFVSAEGSLKLGGGTFGVGGNVGIEMRMMSKRLRLGASYRSATALNFDGTASFDVPPELEAQLRDQDVHTTFVLPHTLSFGAAFLVTPRVLLTAESTYTTWSTLQSIDLDFEDDSLDQSLRRDWNNTASIKVAGDFKLTREISLRGGLGFDPTPSPDDTTQPSLPDASRMIASVGAGYRMGNIGFDLGYLFALLLPKTTTGEAYPATYSGMAHVISLGASFRQ